MAPLPGQAVHLPFAAGPYRMAMDLRTVPEADWFEFDHLYHAEMAEKRRLLASSFDAVFAALPVSDAARAEALDVIIAALTKYHPDWFHQDGKTLHNHLTGETWIAGAIDPLDLAGRLVQEDLCLVQNDNAEPVFTAASLCFPSRWRLIDKLGKPLSAVHGPVPFYGERLARPVNRFFQHLKVGHIAERLNWSLLDDPALFQPGGKWRVDFSSDVTAGNAGTRVFLRVERQTLGGCRSPTPCYSASAFTSTRWSRRSTGPTGRPRWPMRCAPSRSRSSTTKACCRSARRCWTGWLRAVIRPVQWPAATERPAMKGGDATLGRSGVDTGAKTVFIEGG